MFGKIFSLILFSLVGYGFHMAYAFYLVKDFWPFFGSLAFVMALVSILMDRVFFRAEPVTAHQYRIMSWFMIFAAATIVFSERPLLGYLSILAACVLGGASVVRVLIDDDPDEELA